VVAPEWEKAVCSGTLEEVTRVEGGKAWSWELEKQVPPYLVSFVVGDLATLHREYETRDGRTVPIRLDVPPEDSSDAVRSFSHLKDALTTFEKRFGPYRWPRVGYVAVPFPSGAMEHATNIAYPQASVNGTHSSDDLMAHELAHAWWGNLVTCATPWDMWINEGMASFSEFLFQEGLNGKEAYREAVRKNHKKTLRSAHLQDGNEHRAVYGIPHAYTYGAHVYDKGADMLRTIRYMMPDSLFFGSLRKILNENAYSNMPTHRLVEEWQEYSGRPLESWAGDLLLEPGFPHFEVERRMYEEKDGGFRVELVLMQRGSHSSERYGPMPVEILLRGKNGEEEVREVLISEARKKMSFQVPFDPVVISADPGGGLATATLTDTATIDAERVAETGRGGVIEFEHTEMKLKVEEGSTPFFVESRQHYVVPGMKGIPGKFRVSEARFWSLDGTYPADSSVSFGLEVDGQQKKGVHPEIHFFDKMGTIDEEELAVFYRPKGKDVWQRCEACRIRTLKDPTDGKARIEIPYGVKGDLVLAAPSDG
jgi:aminopeptidase N